MKQSSRNLAALFVDPVSRESSAMQMVTPAEGPSLGMAPAGMCTWMSEVVNTAGSRPKSSARERM